MDHFKLLTAVHYDLDTGIFTRKVAAGNAAAGSVIGNFCKKGYLKALIMGKYVKLHQLAWFYCYGTWPKTQIDHINGIKHDNRLVNLRVVDTSTNCLNQRGPRTNNKVGYQGVHLIKKTGFYRAKCMVNGVTHHLGVFSTPEEASAAYQSFKSPYLPK